MSPIVLPSDIFPIIARHCHPIDARHLKRLNKEISCVITTNDFVWSEARWRWSQKPYGCWKWALDKGHVDVVRWCLQSGSWNVHIDNDALLSAAENGHVGIMELFLGKGAVDLDARCMGAEVLCAAASMGHPDMVELLLDKGVDLHAYGGLALVAAASVVGDGRHLEVVRLSLEKGVGVHPYGDKALRCAAKNGHFEMVRLLLEKGADVHSAGDEALGLAVREGHLDVVRLLLEKGADMQACGAIRLAGASGRKEVVSLLKEYGAPMPQAH